MIWTCISKKKDINDEINRPLTEIPTNLDFILFFFEIKNCKIEKNKDNQSAKFPKEAVIS